MFGIPDFSYSLGCFNKSIQKTLALWNRENWREKFWRGDPSLWSGVDEDHWVGWLNAVETQFGLCDDLTQIASEIRRAGFEDLLILGMGGSSLCSEILGKIFGRVKDYPNLHVLDSTVPAQIIRIAGKVNLKSTLCVVASKSGTTLEPNTLCDYFWQEISAVKGEPCGANFVAITDPGSELEFRARKGKYRYIFWGVPQIGGRYSALCNFGMVPAALIGIDLKVFLKQTDRMVTRCGPDVPVEENPGVVLGVILGELARAGFDKVTLVLSPEIRPFGVWLEQLLSESLGKKGLGMVPVEGEPLGTPKIYGRDRIFVYIRSGEKPDFDQDTQILKLQRNGHPVVRIKIENPMNLGGEFFRWEVATAAAGSLLGINPFNQPNVQESKENTARLIEKFESNEPISMEKSFSGKNGLQILSLGRNTDQGLESLEDCLYSHFEQLSKGDYVAICAFVEMNEKNNALLQRIRLHIRDHKRVATTLGYGPRFLHSTGQLHKGGPNNGVFLYVTADDIDDLPIPGRSFTFGELKAAQAQGDAQALCHQNEGLFVLIYLAMLKWD